MLLWAEGPAVITNLPRPCCAYEMPAIAFLSEGRSAAVGSDHRWRVLSGPLEDRFRGRITHLLAKSRLRESANVYGTLARR